VGWLRAAREYGSPFLSLVGQTFLSDIPVCQ
jgi:hypothetical protein